MHNGTKTHKLNFILVFFHLSLPLYSTAVCDDIWSRDDHHPADDLSDGKVPRHVEQCARVYEAARGAEGVKRTRYGLCGLHLGHDKGTGHRKGNASTHACRHTQSFTCGKKSYSYGEAYKYIHM